jgi:hypothetical protein
MNNKSLKYFTLWLWHKKEAIIWIVALIILAISNPAVHHYTLCPLENLGISYCPGCGLGRSIGYFFRLDMEASLLAHPLGIPAVILLLYRSVKILITPDTLNLSTT